MSNSDDDYWMTRALAQASRGIGLTSPNPPVGAVLVKNSAVIGEGYHTKAGGPHAEIEAMRDAAYKEHDVQGATVYVTLEPCSTFGRTPPCTEALVRAGISSVVYGAPDPNPKPKPVTRRNPFLLSLRLHHWVPPSNNIGASRAT